MESETSTQEPQNGFSQGEETNNTDEDARKLFVGALPPSATKEDVQSHFSQFGDVEMCTIKTDVYTGRSRGFGFLIFKTVDAVNLVLNCSEGHIIHGKKVDPKLATPQTNKNSGGAAEEKSTKVFVGGIEKGTTKDAISAAFSDRGNVIDVYLPTDKMTGDQKGFAFVNFDNSSIAEQLCEEGKIVINGKECDIKRANNKNESRGGGRGGMRGGFRGSRGGGRGGGWGGNSWGGGYDQYGGSGYGFSGGYGGGGYSGHYDQYGGGGYGYQGGYGGQGYGSGYDQYAGGYDQGAAYNNNYGGGFGQNNWGQGNNSYNSGSSGGGQDQYKMKAGRGRGGAGYQPY